MQATDREKFALLMTGVAELYGKTMSDALLEIYWRTLDRYEFHQVDMALSRHAVNPDGGQFMPKPADIVRQIDGSGTGKSGIAWTKVHNAVRLVGGYDSVVFDDPITQAVLHDMGGWLVLCDKLQDPRATNTNFPFVQREFEQRYRGYLETGRAPSYPRALPGRIDAVNLQLGKPPSAPVLIGDESKARLVYEQGSEQKLISHTKAVDLLPQPQRIRHAPRHALHGSQYRSGVEPPSRRAHDRIGKTHRAAKAGARPREEVPEPHER